MASNFKSYLGQNNTNIAIAVHISKSGILKPDLFSEQTNTNRSLLNTDEDCLLSTVPINIPFDDGESNIFFSPLLINVPSIKTKIDVITRNLTISSSALTISNSHYKGWKFIERFNDCIGYTVKIYYVSPEGQHFTTPQQISFDDSSSTIVIDDITGFTLAYEGRISKINYSKASTSLTTTGISTTYMATSYPTKKADEPNVIPQDKGKFYPMVYGYAENVPTIRRKNADGNVEIVSDIGDCVGLFHVAEHSTDRYPWKRLNEDQDFTKFDNFIEDLTVKQCFLPLKVATGTKANCYIPMMSKLMLESDFPYQEHQNTDGSSFFAEDLITDPMQWTMTDRQTIVMYASSDRLFRSEFSGSEAHEALYLGSGFGSDVIQDTEFNLPKTGLIQVIDQAYIENIDLKYEVYPPYTFMDVGGNNKYSMVEGEPAEQVSKICKDRHQILKSDSRANTYVPDLNTINYSNGNTSEYNNLITTYISNTAFDKYFTDSDSNNPPPGYGNLKKILHSQFRSQLYLDLGSTSLSAVSDGSMAMFTDFYVKATAVEVNHATGEITEYIKPDNGLYPPYSGLSNNSVLPSEYLEAARLLFEPRFVLINQVDDDWYDQEVYAGWNSLQRRADIKSSIPYVPFADNYSNLRSFNLQIDGIDGARYRDSFPLIQNPWNYANQTYNPFVSYINTSKHYESLNIYNPSDSIELQSAANPFGMLLSMSNSEMYDPFNSSYSSFSNLGGWSIGDDIGWDKQAILIMGRQGTSSGDVVGINDSDDTIQEVLIRDSIADTLNMKQELIHPGFSLASWSPFDPNPTYSLILPEYPISNYTSFFDNVQGIGNLSSASNLMTHPFHLNGSLFTPDANANDMISIDTKVEFYINFLKYHRIYNAALTPDVEFTVDLMGRNIPGFIDIVYIIKDIFESAGFTNLNVDSFERASEYLIKRGWIRSTANDISVDQIYQHPTAFIGGSHYSAISHSMALNDQTLGIFSEINQAAGGYGIVIDQRTKLKDLIYKLLPQTPFYMYIDENSNWAISYINDLYDETEDGISFTSKLIDPNDVIDYNFKLSPDNQVISKVKVKYNFSRVTNSYLNEYPEGENNFLTAYEDPNVNSSVSGFIFTKYLDEMNNEITEYYDKDYYPPVSDKIIEADAIQDGSTAKRLAQWTLKKHCNQSVMLELTLPIKYFDLNVGDVIWVSDLINNQKAFGVDYSKQFEEVLLENGSIYLKPQVINGQQRTKYFIITEISRDLNKVKLSAQQTINTISNIATTDNVYIEGCNIKGAVNYNPFATIDDGSCYFIGMCPATEESLSTNYNAGMPCGAGTEGFDVPPLTPNDQSYYTELIQQIQAAIQNELVGTYGDEFSTDEYKPVVYSDDTCCNSLPDQLNHGFSMVPTIDPMTENTLNPTLPGASDDWKSLIVNYQGDSSDDIGDVWLDVSFSDLYDEITDWSDNPQAFSYKAYNIIYFGYDGSNELFPSEKEITFTLQMPEGHTSYFNNINYTVQIGTKSTEGNNIQFKPIAGADVYNYGSYFDSPTEDLAQALNSLIDEEVEHTDILEITPVGNLTVPEGESISEIKFKIKFNKKGYLNWDLMKNLLNLNVDSSVYGNYDFNPFFIKMSDNIYPGTENTLTANAFGLFNIPFNVYTGDDYGDITFYNPNDQEQQNVSSASITDFNSLYLVMRIAIQPIVNVEQYTGNLDEIEGNQNRSPFQYFLLKFPNQTFMDIVSGTQTVPGDLDNDGQFTASDLDIMLEWLEAGGSPSESVFVLSSLDTNSNGVFDWDDYYHWVSQVELWEIDAVNLENLMNGFIINDPGSECHSSAEIGQGFNVSLITDWWCLEYWKVDVSSSSSNANSTYLSERLAKFQADTGYNASAFCKKINGSPKTMNSQIIYMDKIGNHFHPWQLIYDENNDEGNTTTNEEAQAQFDKYYATYSGIGNVVSDPNIRERGACLAHHANGKAANTGAAFRIVICDYYKSGVEAYDTQYVQDYPFITPMAMSDFSVTSGNKGRLKDLSGSPITDPSYTYKEYKVSAPNHFWQDPIEKEVDLGYDPWGNFSYYTNKSYYPIQYVFRYNFTPGGSIGDPFSQYPDAGIWEVNRSLVGGVETQDIFGLAGGWRVIKAIIIPEIVYQHSKPTDFPWVDPYGDDDDNGGQGDGGGFWEGQTSTGATYNPPGAVGGIGSGGQLFDEGSVNNSGVKLTGPFYDSDIDTNKYLYDRYFENNKCMELWFIIEPTEVFNLGKLIDCIADYGDSNAKESIPVVRPSIKTKGKNETL